MVRSIVLRDSCLLILALLQGRLSNPSREVFPSRSELPKLHRLIDASFNSREVPKYEAEKCQEKRKDFVEVGPSLSPR
jgi:hypothetical protein